MDGTTLCAFALLIGLFATYVWRQRRTLADGKAMWWATVSEPRAYVSDDPFDDTVSQRAANARALLEAHGNKYLDPQRDVWEFVYAATPQTPTRDFELWQDTVYQEITKRREAWRQQKAGYNPGAAKQHFAGQAYEWNKTNPN